MIICMILVRARLRAVGVSPCHCDTVRMASLVLDATYNCVMIVFHAFIVVIPVVLLFSNIVV